VTPWRTYACRLRSVATTVVAVVSLVVSLLAARPAEAAVPVSIAGGFAATVWASRFPTSSSTNLKP
jgi:hypothetical protein